MAGERSSSRAPPPGVQSHRQRVLFRLRQEVIHLLVLAALLLCNRHQKTVLIFPCDMILPQIPTKGPSILSSCWRGDTSLPRLRSNTPPPPPATPPSDLSLYFYSLLSSFLFGSFSYILGLQRSHFLPQMCGASFFSSLQEMGFYGPAPRPGEGASLFAALFAALRTACWIPGGSN